MSEARLGDAHQDSHQDRHQGGGYRRIELITGEARRRPWTAEEKAMILAESFQPGAKVADVARRHGMNRSLLWNWRHEARKRGAGGVRAFVPIRVVDERAAARYARVWSGDSRMMAARRCWRWQMAKRKRSPARSRLR